MGRRLSLLAGMIALACALMLPASASAAQRFGSPGASGPNPCNPDACSLTDAVNNASVGDEVIVAPGDYDIGEGNLLLDVANLKVHGVEGQPRPVIRGEPAASPLMNITATGAGAIVRHLSLRQDGTGGANGVSVTLNADALSTSSDLLLTDTRIGGTAARLGSAATLASSTARAPDGAGVMAFGAPGPTLHNVTAWGGTTGIAAEMFAAAVATNTIARAPGGTDLSAGLGASITMANSNFDSTSGSIASLAGNQSDAPVLADPTNGDFHQRKGSPTIDAGQLDPLAGLTDFDGDARVLGGVQDIGCRRIRAEAADCRHRRPGRDHHERRPPDRHRQPERPEHDLPLRLRADTGLRQLHGGPGRGRRRQRRAGDRGPRRPGAGHDRQLPPGGQQRGRRGGRRQPHAGRPARSDAHAARDGAYHAGPPAGQPGRRSWTRPGALRHPAAADDRRRSADRHPG